MKINLEPRYQNYWLDLAREEEEKLEEEKKKKAQIDLLNIINHIISVKKRKRKP